MKRLLDTVSSSMSETEDIARELASVLRAGDTVALYGPLGSGKTCFVRGIARGLNCQQTVKSPTFTLINEYHGNLVLYHIDLYRLEDEAQIEDLGWRECLESNGVVAIEWAEKIKNRLPARRFDVYFDFLEHDSRRLEIIACDNSGNR